MTIGGLAIGDSVGGYRITGLLGSGGLGVVYRAASPRGRPFALKALHEQLCDDELFVRRFEREMRSARRVRHEHLVAVVDGGRAGRHPYLIMPLIEGGTLAARIQRDGVLDVADAARLVTQLGAALDALHAAGLVHRDVKPANVMLSPDKGAMLTDFGLARAEADSALSRSGMIAGTLDYVAPEVIRGEQATASADIYSLAALVYTCLDGQAPFGHRPPAQLLSAILDETPPPPGSWRDDSTPAVGEVVLQALAKDPRARPGSPTQFAQQLEAAVQRDSDTPSG